MSLWLDINYAKIAGGQLERFHIKKESPFLAASRCVICGDSQKVKTKTRFYFYEKDGCINTICHNCGHSSSLGTFLKNHLHSTYNDYVFERFKQSKDEPVIQTKKHVIESKPAISDLGLISAWSLPDNHPAKKYLVKRKLPRSFDFLYTDSFNQFSSQYNDVFKHYKKEAEHPRVVIPYKTKSGKIFCYQGRALGNEKDKYKTVVLPSYENYPKFFGIDRLDISKTIYIVEGAIDSLFINNCIAVTNAALSTSANRLLKSINTITKDSVVLIHDNDPRNPQIIEQYEKSISLGYNVVIWPKDTSEKDINDLILSDKNPNKFIAENTYSGLSALLQFNTWKKL